MGATGMVRVVRNGWSVEPFVFVVFATVYAGMILGELPRLALDSTGVALLGAIALLAGGAMTFAQAGAAVDVPTLALQQRGDWGGPGHARTRRSAGPGCCC